MLSTSFPQPCSYFLLRSLSALAAIQYTASNLPRGGRIAVFTGNFNTDGMFNTLAGLPRLDWLLMTAMDTLLVHDPDFCVFYITGQRNVVADHLLCGRIVDTVVSAPGFVVQCCSLFGRLSL